MSGAPSLPLLPWIRPHNATWLVRLLPIAWLLIDAITPTIGFGRHEMRVAVDVGGWSLPGWGLLPIAAALLAAAKASLPPGSIPVRLHRAVAAAETVGRWLTAPILLLTALRVLSLWDATGVLFPWLSLVWAPHVSIALAMVPFLSGRQRDGRTRRRTAIALGGLFALLYTGYTVYICQMVMLHGDEAQYLRVTQSVLRDGDIDLANNLDGDVREFHVLDVGVHRAPGSSEGKVYSKHPAGLSVLLMPAYEAGLALWGHARLGAALFIALCAAVCVPLLYLWLCRIGFAHSLSLWATICSATTAPLFLFSTQIYPEVPALLVTLLVLLRLDTRWLAPQDAETGQGVRAHWEFGLLGLLVGSLPFLHPRYAPLGLLLGGSLLWQARTDRSRIVAVVGAGILAGLSLILFNASSFDGDWMGNFRPGNAWEENALSVGTWLASLPGHWVHATTGLALNAPWYVVAIVAGLGTLVRHLDRRLLLALGLYFTTAMMNGLHPDWTFGFCLPSRFLVTALPALALCVAAGMDQLRRSPLGGLLLCLGLALSWDLMAVAVQIPELPFEGNHLSRAALASYYPYNVHGVGARTGVPPLQDLMFWSLVGMALVAISRLDPVAMPRRRVQVAIGVALLLGALAPALWGLFPATPDRLRPAVSPYLRVLGDEGIAGAAGHHVPVRRLRESQTGTMQDGRYIAAPGDEAGTLATFFLPIQVPGVYRLSVRDMVALGNHAIYFSHQRSLPARQPFSYRLRTAISVGADSTWAFSYYNDRRQFGYMHVVYSGDGHLEFGAVSQDLIPETLPLQLAEVAHLKPSPPPHMQSIDLDPGRYTLRFGIRGTAWSTLLQPHPEPVQLAVAVSDGSPITRDELQPWFETSRTMRYLARRPEILPLQREALVAPWWSTLPVIGALQYELSFVVRQAGPVWFLYEYEGGASLQLDEIVVYRQFLDERPD